MTIPPDMAKQIDNLPPGSQTATSLLQNPAVATLASVPISAMAGTPISPNQVMMGAKFGNKAIKARSAEKEQVAEERNGPAP